MCCTCWALVVALLRRSSIEKKKIKKKEAENGSIFKSVPLCATSKRRHIEFQSFYCNLIGGLE